MLTAGQPDATHELRPSETFWLNKPSECDSNHLPGVLQNKGLAYNVKGYSEFNRYLEIEESAKRWASVWGGITTWEESLEVMFQGAAFSRDSVARIDQFMLDVLTHANTGRDLLHLLTRLDGELPTDHKAIKILWKLHTKTAVMLLSGIAMIEARVSVLKRQMFVVSEDRHQVKSCLWRMAEQEERGRDSEGDEDSGGGEDTEEDEDHTD